MIYSDETKVGEEKSHVMVKMEGDDNKISLNSQYLLDVLTYIHADNISFEISDKVSPAVIRPIEKKTEKDYVYIIMPLKV